MSHPWEFHWYFNQLPRPTGSEGIQSHHYHAILKYCNLSELYYAEARDLWENHRFEFPDWIEFIDLSYNTIYDMFEGSTIDYPLPKNLELLNVSVNKLTRLPERLPSTLTGIKCNGNQIARFPKVLPRGLENIDAGYNCLTEWVPKVRECDALRILRLNNNRIRVFDWEWVLGAKVLEELNLNENQLQEVKGLPASLRDVRLRENLLTSLPPLPPQLEILEVSGNRLKEVANLPHTLRKCWMANNQLTSIDEEGLMACDGLDDLDYQGNPQLKVSEAFLDFIEERFHDIWVSGARQRAVEALQRGETKHLPPIYDDPQNVHHVDASLLANANYLMGGSVEDHALDPDTKEELLEEAQRWGVPEDVRGVILEEWEMRSRKSAITVSVGELWLALWGRLRGMKRKEREVVLSILVTEVRESHNVCFTGRVGRILGILQGFEDGIELKIPLNEQIVARYTACQRRLERKKIPEDTLTYAWELECSFLLELMELGLNEEKREEWLMPVKEQVREEIERIGESGWSQFWEHWRGDQIEEFEAKKELLVDFYSGEYPWLRAEKK